MSVLDEFCRFYESLDANPLSDLEKIYTSDIEFCDPVHCIKGMPAFNNYFKELMQEVDHCRFEIHEVSAEQGQAFVSWTMRLRHPRLNGGDQIDVEGMSHLRFEEKIYYHRDYFDLGAMLYEHIPLIGRIIKTIKNRLKQ